MPMNNKKVREEVEMYCHVTTVTGSIAPCGYKNNIF